MSENKDIIFLGRFFTPSVLEKVMADPKYNIGISNHNFEMSLIDGLMNSCRLRNINLRIISVPAVFSYPQYNSHIFMPSEKYVENGVQVSSIPVLSLVGLNKIWILFSLLITLVRAYSSAQNKNISLIVNTPDWIDDTAVFVSRLFTRKKVSAVLVVPDIPEIMNTMFGRKRTLKRRLVSLLNRYGQKVAHKYDGYVFLTEQMKEFFRKGAPHIVMEGIANSKWFSQEPFRTDSPEYPVILYTGSICRVFGIKTLVDAFSKMKNGKAELWICGDGDMAEELRNDALTNPRIKFLGMVSAEKARELQMRATVLVNPRNSSGEFTKYSFPSKTMEYLASGKPVVMNRLPGIPGEYLRYLFIPADESADALAATLDAVLNMPADVLENIGKKGKTFVMENKNSGKQAERIIDFSLML